MDARTYLGLVAKSKRLSQGSNFYVQPIDSHFYVQPIDSHFTNNVTTVTKRVSVFLIGPETVRRAYCFAYKQLKRSFSKSFIQIRVFPNFS